MNSLTAPIAILALTLSVPAQVPQSRASEWSPKSKRAAEDAVAKKIDEIRASAKRPHLRRVSPSTTEVQLVCTAALTGAKVHDPLTGGLQTYVTNDLSAETEAFNKITLFPDKHFPRYSVIVVQNANSTPENPSYTVGVARRLSPVMEFFGPLFLGDKPFEGVNEWKKQVVPQCRSRTD